MQIIPATFEHLPQILKTLESARQIMRQTGNFVQWTNGYPSESDIRQDIDENCAYVLLHDQQVVGYFYFKSGIEPEPTYKTIENGQWENDYPYGVIHRLASNSLYKGVADAVFEFAFSKISTIRVDTHQDNIPMRRFLEKNKFTYCGIIYVSDGSPRMAYMKTIPLDL